MKTVIIENNELRLNSNLNELDFGKISYSSLITQGGILAKCDSTAQELAAGRYHFSFDDWYFNEVKSFDAENSENKGPYVFYCGKAEPFTERSKTLLEFFEAAGAETAGKTEKDEMFKAAFCVCSALTQAANSKFELPINGAGGILVDLSEAPSILFLPKELYRYSVNALPQLEYANFHGCWVNSTLVDLPALCFLRGVIAYKMLTGRYPFPDSDEVKRNADIYDKKFLPLELCINGINKKLATEINKALQLNANIVSVPGKKVKGKSNEDLTPTADFPLELLYSANTTLENTKISDQEFLEKADNYLKSQNSKVETKRKIRRNKTRIISFSAIAVVLILITMNTIKTHGEEFTSRGLTSTQTIEAFFQAMNTKDSTLAVNMTKGSKVRRNTDTISQMYVISKQRQSYNAGDHGFVEPERWLLYVNDADSDTKTGMFGATNLIIDDKPVDINVELYTKAQKPEPLTEENGEALEKGSKAVHKVEYFLLHSEGTDTDDYGFVVDHVYGTYTLTYSSKRWAITAINVETEPVEFDSYQFKKEYYDALAKTDCDVKKAVNMISYRYYWLPTDAAIDNCILRIQQERDEYAEEFEPFFK